MDTMSAFAMGEANRGNPMKVFDWHKAAKIIKDRNAKEASAGLSGDWEWTGGEILKDGKPVASEDTYTYLSSCWATPELEVDGEVVSCYTYEGQGNDWDSSTYWPESAIEILNSHD